MTLTAALVKEQGVKFVVVLVKRTVLSQSRAQKASAARDLSRVFPGNEVILCAQDDRGVPTYFGRPDIVGYLARVYVEHLPWREFHRAA